jgi:hypothetical protein
MNVGFAKHHGKTKVNNSGSTDPAHNHVPQILHARYWWATLKLRQISVALVAEIGDPDLAGEESVGNEVPQETEVIHRPGEARFLLGILAIRYQVENFGLLGLIAFEPGVAVFPRRGHINPREEFFQRLLIITVLAGQ